MNGDKKENQDFADYFHNVKIRHGTNITERRRAVGGVVRTVGLSLDGRREWLKIIEQGKRN